MPYLSSSINELPTHVFLPIIRQLAHRLLHELNFSEEIGDAIYINTDWSTHYKTSDIDNNINVGQQGLRIDAQIQMNPTQQKFDCYTFYHTAAYGFGHRTLNALEPIYWDRENRVRIVQIESPVTISMNCELTLSSVDLAYQAPIRIFNGYENGSVHKFNDIAYDYPIPKSIVSVLYGLWKMDRVKGQPANVPFVKYLQLNSDGKWNILRHRDKDQYEIIAPVFDLQSLAVLEYSDDRPQAMMENRLPIGFNIPFSYIVQFGMPVLNIMQFPVVYNNQLVPKEFIPVDRHSRFNNIKEYDQRKEFYMYNQQFKFHTRQALRMPEYDEWYVPSTTDARFHGHLPIVIAHVLVDESKNDLTTEINLDTELTGEAKLTPFIKEVLYQQGELSVRSDGIYSVAVYKDDWEMKPGIDYTFNEKLIVKFIPSDLTSHYRVVIFGPKYLNSINKKWWPLLGIYYPFIPQPIKSQVKAAVENGSWLRYIYTSINKPGYMVKEWNEGWWTKHWKKITPGYIRLADNGDIVDNHLNVIGNITELTKKENFNAPDTDTRIINNVILPQRATRT